MDLNSRFFERALLILGILVWITVQGLLVNVPLWSRNMPVEPDDAYAYIVKAAEMQTCFFQDCPALSDLQEQLTAGARTADPRAIRRAFGHLLSIYHPLHSVMMVLLHSAGLSWETSFKIIGSAAPLLFAGGLAWLLTALFGPGAAGIALILLAFRVFAGQGLHNIVPSNLALGVAFFFWARIVAARGRIPWDIPLWVLLLVAMHTIGAVYSAIGLVMMLALSGRPKTVGQGLVIVIGGLFMVLPFLLPSFISRPFLRSPIHYPHLYFSYHDYFREFLRILANRAWHMLSLGHGVAAFMVLFFLGIARLPRQENKPFYYLYAMIVLFAMASPFYIVARKFPGEIFNRVWVPLEILTLTVMSYGIYTVLFRDLKFYFQRSPDGKSGLAPGGFASSRGAIGGIILAGFLGLLFQTVYTGAHEIKQEISELTASQSFMIDPVQPTMLAGKAKPGDRVLYTDGNSGSANSTLISASYFFSHGALNLGAVYEPAVKNTPNEKQNLGHPAIRFGAFWSPINRLQPSGLLDQGGVSIGRLKEIVITGLQPREASQIGFLVKNASGRKARLSLSMTIDESPDPVRNSFLLDRFSESWVSMILGPDMALNRLALAPKIERGGDLILYGIRFDSDQTCWPWGRKAVVWFIPKNGPEMREGIVFDIFRYLPRSFSDRGVQIMNDRGSTVLMEFQPPALSTK